MSIMQSIFGRKPDPAPAAPGNPTNNPAKNPPPAAAAPTPGTDQNGVIPPGGADGNTENLSPMDKFKDLWQPTPVDPNSKTDATNQPEPVNPQKLMEAAAKVDFSKIVTPEMLTAIAGGGETAAQAFVQAMNLTAQTVYGQSAVTTSKIVEQAVSQAREQFVSEIPGILRNQNIRGRVFEENPAFSNPAIAPLIEAQVQQLANKFPKASPAELNTMAKEYLQGMAALINPPKADASGGKNQTGKGETNWDEYLSNPT